MGVLIDEPSRPESGPTGEGAKFVALFDAMDADDQAMIRQWDDAGVAVIEIWRRLIPHFRVGRSTVERGLMQLRVRWAAS